MGPFSEIVDGGMLGVENNCSPKHSIFRGKVFFPLMQRKREILQRNGKNLKGFFFFGGCMQKKDEK